MSACFLSQVREIVLSLVRALIKRNPVETLQYFLPTTCQSIEKLLNTSESVMLLTDEKEDLKIIWYLILFMKFVDLKENDYDCVLVMYSHQAEEFLRSYC